MWQRAALPSPTVSTARMRSAAQDQTLEDPIDRAAVEQLGGALGGLAGAQHPGLTGLVDGVPGDQLLDVLGADDELDEVQGHAARIAQT